MEAIGRREPIQNGTYMVKDIARILNVSITTGYAIVKEGNFKVIRIGRVIRISKQSFHKWLDEYEMLQSE